VFDIKSFMTSDIITVKREHPISHAIEMLLKNDVTGLPVIDDDNKLVGIISEKDIMEIVFSSTSVFSKVEDYMTKEVVSFSLNDDFTKICECLIHNNFRRVPILKEGKLVGIISRSDIIKYLFEPIEYM
jgi:CBS domain-containing protein